MKSPDVLSSKIKKLRIELPQYSFSHSSAGDSSGDSAQTFVGRKRSVEKLQKLIEDDTDKTGVYLVAGNRGVGKTRLVNHVARLTSLQDKSSFSDNMRYLLLLLFAVAGVQFCLQVLGISQRHPIRLGFISFWVFVLSFVVLCCFNTYNRKSSKRTNWNKFIKNGVGFALEELRCLINPVYPYGMGQCLLKVIITVSFTQFVSIITGFTPTIVLIMALAVVLYYMFVRYRKIKLHEYKQNNDKKNLSKGDYRFFQLKKLFLTPIWNYIKNHNRLYLRINFGHKLKDEKDILRLIARTLSTEYSKYRRSFRRMLPWRAMALGLLFLFAYLFSSNIKEQKFYKPIMKSPLYKFSSQAFLNDTIYINGAKYVKKDTIYIGEKEISLNSMDSIRMEKAFLQTYSRWTYSKVPMFSETETFLLVIDQLVFNVSKCVKKSAHFFLYKYNKNIFDKKFVPPIDYLFWLSFLLMYLFSILLFRSNWITHFFVTHRIIAQRLKKLNSDITHSTERELSTRVGAEGNKYGIATKTKKSRNVADAREIEKELQDILNDIQRIPVVTCRPSLVIVFDELDKVEPGDANMERETPQTKASLFSINATRERQTEILRILSNMKYFLSTAQAKFIFIAGREMFDIHLADVSERNNYIGSIFNAVINVPSFLTDHPTGKTLREESSIASLPEEFVCRRLLPPPHEYQAKSYDLRSYRVYLEDEVYNYKAVKDNPLKIEQKKEIARKVQKIIAVLQQFIVYLAHVSKGAPKKMVQLFDSFVEVGEIDKNKEEKYLVVQRYHSSRYFLSFSYYRQYTLGIIAYLMTPIFYRLAESNIKEHSDKLLVSSLRFVDFLFKFHKYSFSWKHLEISPEMLEVNRAPELKSVAVDLLNYLTQVHINKSNFSLYDYKFDSWIANEIFTMTKTDDLFSALFSFSLDETLSLKKHYQDLLETAEKEYQYEKDGKTSIKYIDAISSLQIVLGDLYYYDDELEEAAVCYKNAVEMLREPVMKKDDNEKYKDEETWDHERLYLYVRNTLKLGMIHEKRKQYDFAYLTYGEICKQIIRERNITIKKLGAGVVLRKKGDNENVFAVASKVGYVGHKNEMYYDNIEVPLVGTSHTVDASIASPQPLYFKNISPKTNDMLFKKMTYEGLKQLYLPFIAKLQILEKSHIGGITRNHLWQLDREIKFLTFIIDHNEAKLLEAEFYSRVADILYYKNSDLKYKNGVNRMIDKDTWNDKTAHSGSLPQNHSCTACHYYHKALSILLGKTESNKPENKEENTVIKLLYASVEQLKDNYNMKYCTILARILSDWGNVFFSCDSKSEKNKYNGCYICDATCCNTANSNLLCTCYIYDINDSETNDLGDILKKYINRYDFSKMKIAFAMYSISSKAYCNANLYKRSAYQIYKVLRLFKYYRGYNCNKATDSIKPLSEKAIHYLWYANEDLNVLELNKRKKDFGKTTVRDKDIIPLQSLLVDSEITKIRVLVKELELKSDTVLDKKAEKLRDFYGLYITSPYRINYSIGGRIYRLRLKSKVNYEAYKMLVNDKALITPKPNLTAILSDILECDTCNDHTKTIFEEYYKDSDNERMVKINILENIIADSIYCLIDIIQLSKTMGETHVFTHSFLGSVHEHLSFWIRLYETYEKDFYEKYKDVSQVKTLLKKYLDEEWREMLSGYRENQQALSYYYKALEMHSEGRAYHNTIDTMCYVRDDYNDRSDHFNIAEERHLIVNGVIHKNIDRLKNLYKDSKLYDPNNYFGNG